LLSKYTERSATQINLWVKNGLLDDFRGDLNKKRRFSIIEIIWVGIINELREFGLSKEKIKLVKEELLRPIKGIDLPYPSFEFFLISVVLYQRPYFLLIDKDGNSNVLGYDNYLVMLQSKELVDHIVISLGIQFRNLLSKVDSSKAQFNELFKLSEEELELLAFIKNNDYEQVTVKIKDEKFDLLEGTERVAVERRIVDILNDGAYQRIELQQERGSIVYVNRTIRKKLNKD
jgi:DNA-binding transcriptional MerR regulator